MLSKNAELWYIAYYLNEMLEIWIGWKSEL